VSAAKTVVLGSETTRLERVFGSRQVAVAVRPAVAAAPFVVSAGEGGSCSSILWGRVVIRATLVGWATGLALSLVVMLVVAPGLFSDRSAFVVGLVLGPLGMVVAQCC